MKNIIKNVSKNTCWTITGMIFLCAASPLAAQNANPTPHVLKTDNITEQRNIVYAKYGDREMRLDLYSPKLTSKTEKTKLRPAVVVVHGGGWLKGDRLKFRPLASALAARGYVAVTIEYRLGSEAKFPAAVHDCYAAVRWLRANAPQYSIDPKRIAAVGGSAGGHLVGLIATAPHITSLRGEGNHSDRLSAIQAAVVMAGPLDLATGPVAQRSRQQPNKSNSNRWLGKSIDEAPDLYRLASATTHLSKNTPPILFMTGEFDNPKRNIASREKLRSLGIATGIQVYKDGKHGCWNRNPWFDVMVNDIDRFLSVSLKHTAKDLSQPIRNTDWGSIRRTSSGLLLRVTTIPKNGIISVPRLNNPIQHVFVKANNSRQPLRLSPGLDTWSIQLQKGASAPVECFVETIGAPYLPTIPRIVSASSGPIILAAHDAVTHGKLLRYEPQPHKNTVGYWANKADWCEWHFYTDAPGKYEVHVLQGCGKGHGGSKVAVTVGKQRLTFMVEDTGHFQNFKKRNIGTIEISAGGVFNLQIRAISKTKGAVMDVRRVTLVPVK